MADSDYLRFGGSRCSGAETLPARCFHPARRGAGGADHRRPGSGRRVAPARRLPRPPTAMGAGAAAAGCPWHDAAAVSAKAEASTLRAGTVRSLRFRMDQDPKRILGMRRSQERSRMLQHQNHQRRTLRGARGRDPPNSCSHRVDRPYASGHWPKRRHRNRRKACHDDRPAGPLGPRWVNAGAGEGNRTLVVSLGSFCSAIELHPLNRGKPPFQALPRPAFRPVSNESGFTGSGGGGQSAGCRSWTPPGLRGLNHATSSGDNSFALQLISILIIYVPWTPTSPST